MAGMSGKHRTAAGLAKVTDIQPLPPGLGGGKCRKVLQEIDGDGLCPVPVAAEAHRLPCGPRFGQLDRTRLTAERVGPDCLRAMVGPVGQIAEHLFRDAHVTRRRNTGGSWACLGLTGRKKDQETGN